MTAVAATPAETRAELRRAREKTATRLLGSSSKNSYDPLLDIDWDAEVDLEMAYMPFERVSIYGTPEWDALTESQKIELSKHELASIASTGLWFEILLIQMLARYAYHEDPQGAHTQYALTEIGDETRHVIMFAKAVARMGAPTYRPPAYVRQLAKLYAGLAKGVGVFAPVLVAEEITDRLQRETMNDEAIHPLIRMVNRIHVVEEARHVRFAREEVARLMPSLGPISKVVTNTSSAVVAAFVVHVLINPEVYASVGLDPKRTARLARANPNNHETRRWMGEKIMKFLDEQGMVTWSSRPIYKLVHLL
jgi:hypothetical protein